MKSAVLTALKVGIALVLIWYVFTQQIQYEDAILIQAREPGAARAELLGRIEGDWQGQDWRFLPDGGGEALRPPLPADHHLRPGFFTLLREIRVDLALLSLALWGVLIACLTLRWMLLLRAAGVPTGYGSAMRLCFIGYFFNIIMPGITGGDLVRAYLVTRGLEARRARAFMSVLVDRALGLFSLLVLAGLVLLVAGDDIIAGRPGLARVRRWVLAILIVAVVGAAVYLSRRTRRALGIDWLLARLPFQDKVAKVDDAVTVYRDRPATLLATLGLSVVLQAAGVVSFWLLAVSLGAGLTLPQVYVGFPVVQTISSVPLSPSGWGVGEWLYGTFFRMLGSTETMGVAASLLFRLATQVGVGLLGGLVWMGSRERRLGASWKGPAAGERSGAEAGA